MSNVGYEGNGETLPHKGLGGLLGHPILRPITPKVLFELERARRRLW